MIHRGFTSEAGVKCLLQCCVTADGNANDGGLVHGDRLSCVEFIPMRVLRFSLPSKGHESRTMGAAPEYRDGSTERRIKFIPAVGV